MELIMIVCWIMNQDTLVFPSSSATFHPENSACIGVPNNQWLDCVFNGLPMLTMKKKTNPHYWPFVRRINRYDSETVSILWCHHETRKHVRYDSICLMMALYNLCLCKILPQRNTEIKPYQISKPNLHSTTPKTDSFGTFPTNFICETILMARTCCYYHTILDTMRQI